VRDAILQVIVFTLSPSVLLRMGQRLGGWLAENRRRRPLQVDALCKQAAS
jgi:hypothetical protein